MSESIPAAPECDGMCLTGSDVGVPSAEIAYPHPGCPLHAPGQRCQCGQPDRCTSYTHDPAWTAGRHAIQWVQDEPRPDSPEDQEHQAAEAVRAIEVEACRQNAGHSWWLELEHPEDGARADLSCQHCPAGVDDLYPDGIDLIYGEFDGVSVDAGQHNSPVPLLIPVDAEVRTAHYSNPIVGEEWDVELIITARGPARPVRWPVDLTPPHESEAVASGEES